ncbi:MAG TPA: hypothetical protein VKV26_00970 [Dehalococcoidia bacterium]|nr:hypothetical protein [Dehalococcoidia bacterium]
MNFVALGQLNAAALNLGSQTNAAGIGQGPAGVNVALVGQANLALANGGSQSNTALIVQI